MVDKPPPLWVMALNRVSTSFLWSKSKCKCAAAASTIRQDEARIVVVATELARPSKAGFFMCLSWGTLLLRAQHQFQ